MEIGWRRTSEADHREIRGVHRVAAGNLFDDSRHVLRALCVVKRPSTPGARLPPGVGEDLKADNAIAAKPTAVTVHVDRVVAWDHTRLTREGRPSCEFSAGPR